jgi:hypothetical protein
MTIAILGRDGPVAYPVLAFLAQSNLRAIAAAPRKPGEPSS